MDLNLLMKEKSEGCKGLTKILLVYQIWNVNEIDQGLGGRKNEILSLISIPLK